MNSKSIITFVVVTVGILAGVVGLLWKFGNPQEKVIADVAGAGRHVQGDGPYTIVEFSDLQCPACRAVQEPLKQLLAANTGKVKFVYRHFPLTSIHKNALNAAYAAEAAHVQGKFWEMHDLLFEKQMEWENEADPHAKFDQYAKDLGLDVSRFAADSDSQEVRDAVNTDSLAASRYALAGTPTFFVNGVQTEFNAIADKLAQPVK